MNVAAEPDEYRVPTPSGLPRLTRRQFLKLALSAGAVLITGCAADGEDTDRSTFALRPDERDPMTQVYDTAQPLPDTPPDAGFLRFFTEHEAATVMAITSRILPGTPDNPGAREAGVVTYIDHMLAYEEGYVQPVYLEGPTVRLYEGDAPPENGDDADVIWIAADEIERYGYQSPLTPAEVYRTGLEALDAYAQAQYGSDYVDLGEDAQDAVVEAMLNNEAEAFEPFSGNQFFQVLRRGTMEGLFCDPLYGGNRDKVGWRLVGYPGAQRAYLPWEVRQPGGLEREPWGLRDLPPFNYSEPRTLLPSSPARRLGPREAERSNEQTPGHSH